jgi:hypothetical protein
LENSLCQGSLWIRWEETIVDDKLMKVILEVVTALVASMAIINREELSLDSFLFDIESDANSIFIVRSRDSLVSIDSVALDEPVLLLGCPSRIHRGYFRGVSLLFALHSGYDVSLSLVFTSLHKFFSFQSEGLNFVLSIFAQPTE